MDRPSSSIGLTADSRTNNASRRHFSARAAEELLSQFELLYPNDAVVRTALRGAAAYRLSWFDAHLWAYAEHYGLDELISEDFQYGRLYGTVRARNPFVSSPDRG